MKKSVLKNRCLAAVLAFIGAGCLTAVADIPQGYYDACKGKSKSSLKSQLYTIVKNHKAISYGDATWSAFAHTDVRDGKYWWDIYTDNNVSISGNGGMNIEHTFPKSWWGGSKNDAYKDIVHLMPANANANNLRSNLPFAEVGTEVSYKQQVPSPRFRYGTPVSGQGGGSSKVFEPDDEYKGDLARTYFYMVTCYQNLTWSGEGPKTAAQGTYPTLQPWAQEMLLRWHRMDPVSDKERDRNEGVYQQQGNRNPFIDHPEMVEHIWGDLQDTGWDGTEIVDPDPIDPDDPDDPKAEPVLTSPLADDFFRMGPVLPGEKTAIEIPVLGKDFTHSIVARISGQDASLFRIAVGKSRLEALTVTPADINNADGYALTIEYSPLEAAASEHVATLTLTGSDLTEAVNVTLVGSTRTLINLPAPVALPAEGVTPESYTARWINPAHEIDGITLYRNIYSEDGATIEDTLTYELDSDTESYTFTDRDENVSESYYLVATLGDTDSEPSNVITLSAVGIEGIAASDGEAIFFTPSGIMLPEAPTAPGVYIITINGRQHKTVIIK